MRAWHPFHLHTGGEFLEANRALLLFALLFFVWTRGERVDYLLPFVRRDVRFLVLLIFFLFLILGLILLFVILLTIVVVRLMSTRVMVKMVMMVPILRSSHVCKGLRKAS